MRFLQGTFPPPLPFQLVAILSNLLLLKQEFQRTGVVADFSRASRIGTR